METNKISTKQTLEFKEATAYLEALLESFKAGKIVVEKDGDFLTMEPADSVRIEISAKAKKGKNKFSMEIGWEASEGGPLTISDKEPQQAAEPTAEPANEPAPEVPEQAAPKVEAVPTASTPAAKPAAQKPAVKKSAAKKTAAKKPAAKKPAAKKPAAKKPAAKKPAAKKPAAKPTTGTT